MENNNRQLTTDDKLWLIETTLNSYSIDEVETAIKDHFGQSQTEEEQLSKLPIETPQTVVEMEMPEQPETHPGQINYQAVKEVPDEASIYASEHRETAMMENGIGLMNSSSNIISQSPIFTPSIEQPKTKILEQPKSTPSKVVYENIRTLSPGQQL